MGNPRTLRALAILPLAAALAACGTTSSSSSFKGEKQKVAQVIEHLSSHAGKAEQGKICSEDLAAGIVAELGGRTHCESALKTQVAQIANTEATVESVTVDASKKTATADVKSVNAGKQTVETVKLVKEKAGWRIASLG